MTPPQIPAAATLSRGALSSFVAALPGVPDPDRKAQLVQLLQADTAVLNQAAGQLTDLALRLLPVGTLAPVEKAAYGRYKLATGTTLCAHVCDALTIVAPLGVQLGVDPRRLSTLPRRWRIYTSYFTLGAQLVSQGMDQRAVLAPMQGLLIDQALTHVHARFRDPGLTRAERDRLLDSFGPALLELERVLTTPAERKQGIQDAKQDLKERLAEAEAEAAYAETLLKLRQRLLVPREELITAARRHQEQKKQQGAQGAKADGAAPKAPGPRRLI